MVTNGLRRCASFHMVDGMLSRRLEWTALPVGSDGLVVLRTGEFISFNFTRIRTEQARRPLRARLVRSPMGELMNLACRYRRWHLRFHDRLPTDKSLQTFTGNGFAAAQG